MTRTGSCFQGAGVVIKILGVNKKTCNYVVKFLLPKGVLEGIELPREKISKLTHISQAEIRTIKTKYLTEFAANTGSDSSESSEDIDSIRNF